MCDCGTCCDLHGHYNGCTSKQDTAPENDPTDDYQY